jgi:hypothetical protein
MWLPQRYYPVYRKKFPTKDLSPHKISGFYPSFCCSYLRSSHISTADGGEFKSVVGGVISNTTIYTPNSMKI